MTYDVAIIGGGIVGLATAYQLSERYPGLRVTVVEKEDRVAAHQTGRNSGVIHSGIYYTPGSLKAENCREGKRALVDFCEREGVAYEMCGKVIVAATEEERAGLHAIYERGQQNGIQCERIGPERLREIEPHTRGVEAIHVPEAGIVDYIGVCERLAARIQERGQRVQTGAEVRAVLPHNGTITLETTAGAVTARYVINCAGLYADHVARMTGQTPSVQVVPFRGEYFDLKPHARHLCRGLIYPVPDPAFPFLGVHFTRMVDGRVECGPSAVLAFAREGYTFGTVDVGELAETLTYSGFLRLSLRHWKKGVAEIWQSLSQRYYLKALRHLIPEISLDDLEPSPSGVRAQAVTPDGALVDDFLIEETERVVNVLNAASPAATASLNVGHLIVDRLAPRLD
ncbi:MAG: L-2-hydroxyglutarate oxidase [Bacteroidetes bacterium]|jgi:L-2-hydroxyglutarate oxidase|nr:L-2-hydroxyglutarate oxidase [Bacteroidota bacterium]